MKTQKLLTLIIAFLLAGTSSFAKNDDRKAIQKTMSFSIDMYITTLKYGNCEDYSSIIADNAKFNLNRRGKVHTHGKSEELKAHSKRNNIIQNCEVNYSVITSSDSYALINVSMKYESFTRENIVSLSKINNAWKITEVNSIFK